MMWPSTIVSQCNVNTDPCFVALGDKQNQAHVVVQCPLVAFKPRILHFVELELSVELEI